MKSDRNMYSNKPGGERLHSKSMVRLSKKWIVAKAWIVVCVLTFVFGLTTESLIAQDRGGRGDRNREGENDGGGRRDRGRERSFDASGFLKRMDRNGSGILEPDEISGRIRNYIEGLGFDANQPIKLEDVLKKVEGNSDGEAKNESSASTNANVVRKVPGFGIEAEEAAKTNLPNFAGGMVGQGGDDLSQFSDSTKEQVESTLRRYDKNGNGMLEQDEWKEARWGNPSPEDSDLNKDGILSKLELGTRYARRESAVNEASGSRDRGDRGRRDDNEERSERRWRGNSSADENSGDDSRNASDRSSSSSDSSSSSRSEFASAPDRNRKYADGLVANYDKDKDGQLSAEEFKSMRRPPAGADADGDGFVTAGELADAFNRVEKATSSGSTVGAASGAAERTSGSERASRRSGSSSSSGGRFSFDVSDTNGDGQVQMHEFAEEWTDETLQKFRELDKNGDGVITRTESSGK